jgi:hypothetical protein
MPDLSALSPAPESKVPPLAVAEEARDRLAAVCRAIETGELEAKPATYDYLRTAVEVLDTLIHAKY